MDCKQCNPECQSLKTVHLTEAEYRDALFEYYQKGANLGVKVGAFGTGIISLLTSIAVWWFMR